MADGHYSDGMAVRREVLGDDHVARAEARESELDREFQELITETAWGSVWARPGLERRERSLLTIALLAALGHRDELALHIRATRNTGASREEVKEALLHVAVYAGVPAANAAFEVARRVYEEEGADGEAG